jgi:hypothetical protein
LGIFYGAIEELQAKLRFEIRQRLAHHALRAVQLATRGRETSLVHEAPEKFSISPM